MRFTPADRLAVQLAKESLALNDFEAMLGQMEGIDPPVNHRFTKVEEGRWLYSRGIFLPTDTVCTSRIHKTEHQFVLSKGKALVWTEKKGWDLVCAPFHGTTYPGTRRAVIVIEDIIWTTFHAVTTNNLKEVEAELFEPNMAPVQKFVRKIEVSS